MITVLTPSYNRRKYLSRLFKSLCEQKESNFQWILIDDGSQDDTEQWFLELPITKFEKEYHKKENGGKHTALNHSHPYIKGELVIIVDSDDWLTEDAIRIIQEDWKNYKENQSICGMTYLRGVDEQTPYGNTLFPEDGQIDSSIHVKVNGKVHVDSCEVIRTDVLKEFPFPITETERFVGETYLWNLSGLKYKMVYRNKIIYIGKYLEGGLTKAGRKMRIKNPYGGMYNSQTYFNKEVCLKQRVKNIWLYICYGKFAGLNFLQICKKSGITVEIFIHYLIGWLLYKYWKYKYE